VVSFFDKNHKALNIARFPTVDPGDRREFRRLRKEEIQKILSRFGSRYRPRNMILVGAESGLRIHHLRVLRVKHLVKLEDGSRDGVPCEHWNDMVELKPPVRISLPKRHYFGKKKAGITYLCGDAVKSIIEDLKARESRGEPIGSDTPLFPVYAATVRPTVPRGESRDTYLGEWHAPGSPIMLRAAGPGSRNGKMIEGVVEKVTVDCATESTLQYDMRILRERAGIPFNKEEERPVSIHSLRKYLRSTLDASVANGVVVNVIIGHSNQVEEHYSGARHLQLEEIRAVYEGAMHRIAISEDVDPAKMLTMANKIKTLEATRDQFEELRTRQEQFENKMLELQRQNTETIRHYEQLLKEVRPASRAG
jgi:integrase